MYTESKLVLKTALTPPEKELFVRIGFSGFQGCKYPFRIVLAMSSLKSVTTFCHVCDNHRRLFHSQTEFLGKRQPLFNLLLKIGWRLKQTKELKQLDIFEFLTGTILANSIMPEVFPQI